MKCVRNSLGVVSSALLFAVAVSMPLALVSTDAAAQEITSSIQGTILKPDGSPAAGASAVVIDGRDGRRQTATTDSRGVVHFRNIKAGGPYNIRISDSGSEDILITDLYTDIAGTSEFTVTLEAANAAVEEIVVTAAQIETITTASGPASTFSYEQITDMPSTSRQITDIIRLDPRINIGQSGDGGDQAGQISCLGGSGRSNSFTIDGVRANDAFGLNLSGNLARFTFPIPFDSVAAAAVEFSPVSVEYGQFSGCNVNVVTQSGGNEFHGGAFYLLNDDGMTGSKILGEKFDQGTFERENYGVDVGGPIIRDKLFFYASYEKFDTASVNPFGAADDPSFPLSQTNLTLAEVNQVRDILINQYGRDPGSIVKNLPVESERVFARIDWNINEDHRVEATYSSIEEATLIGDDIGTGRGPLTFSDNFHSRGSDSETLGLRIYSDWTDRLSTEVRWSTQEVTDEQNPLGGGEAQDAVPIPRIAIGDGGIFFGEFGGQQFASGPGTFRSANQLATEKDQFKIKFDYQAGDHLITAGFEHETADIFNLFIVNGTGTVFFDSIASLQAGTATEIRQDISFTTDPVDAAVVFTRDISSFYVQDQWDMNDSMQLTFGVRYDEYSSNDTPLPNQPYMDRYGLTNEVSFDGLQVVQPRIGLNWTLPDSFGDTRLSFGFGVFSGNDPSVWFSNAFQNFGGAIGTGQTAGIFGATTCTPADLEVLGPGGAGPFTGIPQCVVDAGQGQALATLGAVNATDPNLDLPTVDRYSFGLEHNTSMDSEFFSDWNVRVDLIYGELKNQFDFLNLSSHVIGSAPDGRPIYGPVDPLAPGCNATFVGLREGFSNVTPECSAVSVNQDVLMTNRPGNGGHTFTTSIQLSKAFEFGDGWTLLLNGGYSYNESVVGNPGTSFRATENYTSVVARDIGRSPIGASLRNTPHNYVLNTTFSKEYWSGYKTSITAFMKRSAGNPISAVFNARPLAADIGDLGDRARNLLYVPSGPNDAIVDFDPAFPVGAFFDWVDRNGLKRGKIQKKGGLDESWASDLDIRIQQEIPFFGRSTAKVYVDIENVLNMIDDDWGAKRFINQRADGIQSAIGIVTAGIDPVTDTFTFTDFTPPVETPDSLDSLWKVQLGVRVDF